jgi:hypothetical protein
VWTTGGHRDERLKRKHEVADNFGEVGRDVVGLLWLELLRVHDWYGCIRRLIEVVRMLPAAGVVVAEVDGRGYARDVFDGDILCGILSL